MNKIKFSRYPKIKVFFRNVYRYKKPSFESIRRKPASIGAINKTSPEVDNQVVELTICEQKGMVNIFNNPDICYIIPIYQRPYAWTNQEIEQLIDDINGINEQSYYLGSLIVAGHKNTYEVIDGQQRLTTLFLLMIVLEIHVLKSISFACREDADMTIDRLVKAFDKEKKFNDAVLAQIINNHNYINVEIDSNIVNGIKIISEKITRDGINKNDLKNKLDKVKLFRIEVPPHTDLNHYFQIMNTRGEQLTQHDILKAQLMGFIQDKDSMARIKFAAIWDACADMTGYMQMHFQKQDRDTIFGTSWNSIPTMELYRKSIPETNEDAYISLDEILDNPDKYDYSEKDKIYNTANYESIINFDYFLLHVLRAYCETENIKFPDNFELGKQLDDINLLKDFNKVFDKGMINNDYISINKDKYALNFIYFLLKCRFIFDKYIIKREYDNELSDGEWSLKELKVSAREKTTSYYTNTFFQKNDGNNLSQRNYLNTRIIQLQSALRVSYTSPKTMHWITELLKWLIVDNKSSMDSIDGDKYLEKINSIIVDSVKTSFLIPGDFNLGVKTPHIIFNYLDYLLWKEEPALYSDFKFEFRNSVEHWFPQHPSEGNPWLQKELDYFGNLCLVQRDINSKFSNLPPAAKLIYDSKISGGSLKLRLMAAETRAAIAVGKTWKDKCDDFGKEMIFKLKNACGMV